MILSLLSSTFEVISALRRQCVHSRQLTGDLQFDTRRARALSVARISAMPIERERNAGRNQPTYEKATGVVAANHRSEAEFRKTGHQTNICSCWQNTNTLRIHRP
jgi:hypothetical protein